MWAGWGGGGYDTVKRPRLMVPTNLEIVTVGLDILTTRKVEECRVGESIWTLEQRLSKISFEHRYLYFGYLCIIQHVTRRLL